MSTPGRLPQRRPRPQLAGRHLRQASPHVPTRLGDQRRRGAGVHLLPGAQLDVTHEPAGALEQSVGIRECSAAKETDVDVGAEDVDARERRVADARRCPSCRVSRTSSTARRMTPNQCRAIAPSSPGRSRSNVSTAGSSVRAASSRRIGSRSGSTCAPRPAHASAGHRRARGPGAATVAGRVTRQSRATAVRCSLQATGSPSGGAAPGAPAVRRGCRCR